MKRVSLIAAILCLLFLVGCGEGPGPSDEEAVKIVAELVEASYELNDIYFGAGMKSEVEEKEGFAGIYGYVSDDAPYKMESELREATLNVFTKDYSNIIFQTFLSGYSDDKSGAVVYARYIENGDRLMKRADYEPLVPDARTYDLDNITIVSSRAQTIKATLHSFVNGVPDVDVTVTLRLEERERDGEETGSLTDPYEMVWRLDTPTY